MQVLLLTVLAHSIADFVFQSSQTVHEKNKMNFMAYFVHFITVFFFSFIFVSAFVFESALVLSIEVSALHLAVDLLKPFFSKVKKPGLNFLWFLLDQFIHLVTILFLVEVNGFFSKAGETADGWINFFPLTDFTASFLFNAKNLWTAAIFIFVTFGGAAFMRVLLEYIYRDVPDYRNNILPRGEEMTEVSSKVLTGRVIGILERMIVFVLFITGNVSTIAFILAAKSLSRFRQLNDRDFAEYYLIGTLTSVLVGVFGGLLVTRFF